MTTSYFAKYRGDNSIAICARPPIWFMGKEYRKLAPKNWFLWEYKKGKITEEKYIELYYEQVLNKLDAKKVYHDLIELAGEDAVLVCWCGKDKFCHRHIISEWFKKELGIEITELQIA